MGTKIQSKSYLSGYCSIWGWNDSVNNNILSLYHDGKALKNYQHYDSVLPQQSMMGGQLGYDKEKLRQMILEHESTFRHQLQELHRLYGRQREIMKELKRKPKNFQMEPETSRSCSFLRDVSSDDIKPTWHMSHTSLLHSLLNQASSIQNSCRPSFRKEKTTRVPFPFRVEGSSENCKPPNADSKLLWNRMLDLEIPADVYMTDEGRKLERSFSGFPWTESVSRTKINQTLHNKDINHHQNGDALWSNSCSERNNQLADLNEPIPSVENSVSAIVGNSGTVASTLTDMGREQLGVDPNAMITSNDSHPSTRDACSKASKAVLRKDEFSTSDQGMTKSKMKRKLFGVDIFEIDDKQLDTDSSMANCNLTSNKRDIGLLPKLAGQGALPRYFEGSAFSNWKSAKVLETANKLSNVIQDVVVPEHTIVNADCQIQQNDSKGFLLCSIAKEHHDQQGSTNKKSHHMNLDSLQYSCPQFFQKSRPTSISSQIWVQKHEMTSPHLVQDTEQGNIAVNGYSNAGEVLVEKAISNRDDPKAGDLDLEERINDSLSGSRQHIDLNLSLVEYEAPSAPPFPSTIVKIATPEIDLEASVILRPEADTETTLSPNELEKHNEELLKVAAEAIVAISFSSTRGTLNVAPSEPLEVADNDLLSWFAELVCSYKCDDSSTAAESNVDGVLTEEMIPEGMDYFEFMTLRLKDTKEDNHHYKPKIAGNESEGDEETKVATLSQRPRRGQARKGRQRKEFQRDILPGLVTLSKHEVAKDLQILEELFKSSGCKWQSRIVRKTAGRSWRRRRSSNSGASTPPRESDAVSDSPEQQPQSTDIQVEAKTLSGWGKRTRRLPRQRYTNGSHYQLKP